MDWCVEESVGGALDLAEREVLDHLTRHAEHDGDEHAGAEERQLLELEGEEDSDGDEGAGGGPPDGRARWSWSSWPRRSSTGPSPGWRGPAPAGCRSTGRTRWRAWPAAGWPVLPEEDLSAEYTKGFLISLTLRLPQDCLSVPVVRHLTSHALEEVGVLDEVADDVELALAEACANVLTHSGPGDVYDVSITIGPETRDIRALDIGHGFDHATLIQEMAGTDSESGRGVALMHALMDRVRFTSEPEGTIVHLVKKLSFDDFLPTRRLLLAAMEEDHRRDG